MGRFLAVNEHPIERALRATLAEPEPLPSDVTARLKARLAQGAAR